MRAVWCLCLISCFAVSAFADPKEAIEAEKPNEPAVTLGGVDDESSSEKKEEIVHSRHSVTIDGKEVSYEAQAGFLELTNEDEETKANVFFVSYSVPSESPEARPVTFCFNGGPGSSSVWLHLGMLGPRRVELPSEPTAAKPPTRVIENPYSLLDVTDLVFIDPVSTGYSRPIAGEKKEQFHGYEEDLKSVGRFIHRFTTKYGRWGSPKYLCGESYGTLRAAGLSNHLSDRYNMSLNGIVLVSSVLDFQTISFDSTNDLPYILFLPTYAASAWYHKRLSEEWQDKSVSEVADAAREFAFGDYATLLLLGERADTEKRDAVIARYSELTGLPSDYVRDADLRVSMGRFGKELLSDKGLGIGRFDSRYTEVQRDRLSDTTESDASASALFGPFTSALYQTMRDDLNVEKDVPYEILTGKVHPWNYDQFTNEYVQSAESLSRAMVEQPHMKVFVANGYYDLATPFAASEYTFSHSDMEAQKDNVTFTYYEGGHMMYVHEPSLRKLRTDLLKFYHQREE